MPWKAKDARKKTKKADTPRKREVWREVANRMLGKTGDEGRAIREANAVVDRIGKDRR